MRTLIVIPARGGSKGIPNKNLAMVGGKPLIDWTLDLLPHLDLPDFKAVVSTDSKAIAEHCIRKGVAVLPRPEYLATDDATTLAVLQHAVQDREDKETFDAVLCLQPTNPLRTVQDISAAHRIMAENDCDCVLSCYISSYREKSLLAEGLKTDNGSPLAFCGGGFGDRRYYPDLLKRTGEIYLFKREVIDRGSYGEDRRAYVLPRSRAWNIDEPCDIPIVEGLLRFNGRL